MLNRRHFVVGSPRTFAFRIPRGAASPPPPVMAPPPPPDGDELAAVTDEDGAVMGYVVVGAGSDTLMSGQSLARGQKLVAPGSVASFEMQPDGNLVLYDARRGARRPLFSSDTQGRGVHLDMQGDGNLVLYDAAHHPVWASGTSGHPGLRAVLQPDGNLVLYDAAHRPAWATGTNGFQDVRGKKKGGFLSDVASAVASAYNAIPMPVKAVLAPQALVTEYAYAHPEVIPLFGKQAAQAKAVFQGLQKGNLSVTDAASIAAQAVGPSLHLPPDVAAGVTAAAHMAAANSALASQAMQVAQAAGQAITPADVPHPATLATAPPAPVHPTIHLELARAAAAGAPAPIVQLAPGARQGVNASWEVHI